MRAPRRFFIEWALMCLLLPIFIFGMERRYELLPRLDLALYDWSLTLSKPTPSSDILIVGIDARSLDELGPWPWSRAVHAQLLDRLAPAAPRSVLLNLFLDTPGDADETLAKAMAQLPVYLPLNQKRLSGHTPGKADVFLYPVPAIARSARGLGHANAPHDIDNVMRAMYRYEGLPSVFKPYVGMLIANAGANAGSTAGQDAALAGAGSDPDGHTVARPDGWSAKSGFGLNLAGPDGTFPIVPYLSVLRGEVPPELLRGRDLLVGAVADSGIDDTVSVMVGGRPRLMSGVEVHANAIDALRHGRTIALPGAWRQAAAIALPLWLAMVLFLRMARHALAIALLLCAGCTALSVLLLVFAQVWLGPAPTLIGIAVAYLLWSWRRIDALFVFFHQRVANLAAIPAGAFETATVPPARQQMDAFEQQTEALDRAVLRLTHLQSLLSEGLWQMPVPVLVCRADGAIGQSNAAARALLLHGAAPVATAASEPLAGANLLDILSRMARDAHAEGPGIAAVPSWMQASGKEYMTPHHKEFRVQATPIDADRSNWVVVLRDMSAQYQAERERAQWLGFLSHDLRSPQVSILSLLSLRAERANGMDEARMATGVRREAERTLALAEGLIDVTQALSTDYRFEQTEAGLVVLDAIERADPYAQLRGVSLVAPQPGAHDCTVRADAPLLQRALLNLLNNAIRHSARGGTVRICLEASFDDEPTVVIAIQDDGEGMEAGRLAQLKAYPRPQPTLDGRHGGDVVQRRGLGLSMVHAVVDRHDGWIDAHSAPGAGTTLWIGLPLVA
jgi:CHASE2 domain-containing sensor protein/nitrogen-specific signal transduction histidine kinase